VRARCVVSQPPFPMLLLTTTGARTGQPVTVPLGFAADEQGRVFVVASKAGSPSHPAWFYNLRANPAVTVELGDKSFEARAVVMAGEGLTGCTSLLYGHEKGHVPRGIMALDLGRGDRI